MVGPADVVQPPVPRAPALAMRVSGT